MSIHRTLQKTQTLLTPIRIRRTRLASFFLFATCSLTFLSLTACHFPPRLYKMDVRQGNFITSERVSKLKLGMSRSEVREIMGTPALSHFFQPNRWDYYYYLKPGNGDPIQETHISIRFKGDQVVDIQKSGVRNIEKNCKD